MAVKMYLEASISQGQRKFKQIQSSHWYQGGAYRVCADGSSIEPISG